MKKNALFSRYVLVILLFVVSAIINVSLAAAIPAVERAALIALYNATNGDNWTNNSGWKDGALEADGFGPIGSEGTWYGISVSGDHVTEIWLGYKNLNGSIPAEVGNLSHLEVLELSSNQLTGSIPLELGNLNNLEWLYLFNNQLSGSIPPELGNLSSLKYLWLHSNQLTGSIPAELGNLNNLLELILYINRLSGSIPPELGNLSNLYSLNLSYNELSGNIPAELANISKLWHLFLDWNYLSGNLPPELGNLTGLSTLDISNNNLIGSIPASFINLTSLNYLYSEYTDLAYNGLYTNDDALQTFLNDKDPGWEDSQTIAPSNVSAAAVSDNSIRVSWGPITYVGDTGGYKVYYTTTSGGPWTYAGMTADKSASYYDVTGLNPGTTYYFVVKTQTGSHSNNDNTIVSEASEEVSTNTHSALGEKDPPFGSFDTPIHGSTVTSSIPVTGWALDDFGIDFVKIYRQDNNSLVYIGDAALVEGARPDVAAAYPQYPNNSKAGWGYMLLTNFLPNSGNGTFVLHAIAYDLVGNATTLGTKTIICDNANAVKPFGAIDTPAQGGTASGTGFINWGWVLTPQPNRIPPDGSTINVIVDGVNIGNPTYNNYRADIAGLFPGYANSNGAVGYFYLDTSAYANGVHTIQWTASDDAGNTDGIGSRYFTIQNNAGRSVQGIKGTEDRKQWTDIEIPVDYSTPVRIKRGYNENINLETIFPGNSGIINFEINQLERIVIHLDEGTEVEDKAVVKDGLRRSSPIDHTVPGKSPSNRYMGYLVFGKSVKPLPIGSTFDSVRGIFYWQPGPGFIGEYHFGFVEIGKNGMMSKKYITVNIVPEFTY